MTEQSEHLSALSVMAAGIAHEMRNPLTVMSSATQLLLDEQLTAQQRRECVAKMQRAVQRVSTVVDVLLHFAQPALVTMPRRENFIEIIKVALKQWCQSHGLRGNEIDLRIPEERVEVEGYRDLLIQLVTSLLTRAAHPPASESPDSKRIEVVVSVDSRKLRLGILNRKCFSHCENRSGRLHLTPQQSDLMLSICYAIARQHGGAVGMPLEGAAEHLFVELPLAIG
jgi:light-regulated signal transduction histidine kinase (bacteriophytochrome)